jgi:acetyl-CoA C-acetyltransferase
MTVHDNTPILVGAGQYVEREAGDSSPMKIASAAAANAIDACGGSQVAAAIDTIAVVKIFSDSAKLWFSDQGRSNNPPQSIARDIGANPDSRIYSQIGGNEPQSLLMEFFADLASGKRSVVLLAGSEAIRNQRAAQRAGINHGWDEEFDEALEDRGIGKFVANNQERHNGMIMPLFYYIIIEEARRQKLGLTLDEYRQQLGQQQQAFSAIAAHNPYSQFPGSLTAEEILDAEPLTHLYTKRMIAQDSVNQGAALLLTTVGKARELAIPESNWVYMHGAAQGMEVDLTIRKDPSTSKMAQLVVDHALAMAGKTVADISLIDIYSCFPCAVTAISDHLGLPSDGSTALTLTGGLPYFGGPGNNYSMHGLAEMWSQIRADAHQFALIHANGGVLSKHASGVFSMQASQIDWAHEETEISQDLLEPKQQIADPHSGTVIAYSINYLKGQPAQGIVLCETDSGQRFVSCTAAEDQRTVQAMLEQEPAGRVVSVTADPAQEHTLHFQFRG